MNKRMKLTLNKFHYKVFLEEIPYPCYVWKEKNDEIVLVDYNEIANNMFEINEKDHTKINASDFYKENPQKLKSLHECLLIGSNFTRNFDGINVKYIFIQPDIVVIIEKGNSSKAQFETDFLEEIKNPISKEKEYIEKLHNIEKSQKIYYAVFRNCPDLIFINDKYGKILDANPKAVDFLGVELKKLKGMNLKDFFNRENIDEIPDSQELIQKRIVSGFETRGKDFEGNDFVYEVNAALLSPKEEKENLVVLNIARDITKRKKIEQELQESNEKFQTIAEQSLLTIFIIQDNQIKYRNPNFGKITGYSEEAEDLTFKDIVQMAHPDDREFILQQLRKKQNGEEDAIKHYHFRCYDKDGKLRWLEIFSKTIQYKGKPADFITLLDITDRKKFEKKIKRSKKKYQDAYDKINFYKNLFAHDIKNIIHSIQSSSELIDYYKENTEIEKMEEMNIIIKKQILRAKALVNNIVRLSQIEETQPSLKPINLLDCLKEAIELIKKGYYNNKIDFQIDSFSEEIIVAANELLLDVFENLLINSIKHNKSENIKIWININQIEKEKNKYLEIQFSDNGVGIPDKDKQSIFQKPKNNYNRKGLGLGLKIVKEVIDSYKGEVLIENRIEGNYSKGTKFILKMPLNDH
ncbi:MAG: PAS domain-containing sensor histidine kinase [Candidatus Lokiarchaeota archaeon]